jgi:NAD(P)-dependent dehydrogenase (short-subunit alcohol dehydrogenase family)
MPGGWLEGKTAIVTGSGRGIGRGIAIDMAAQGANVVVVDPGVNMDGSGGESGPAQEVVNEIKDKGGKAVACLEYVGTMDAGERIVQTALDNFGKLDIVVNVAGILRDRMIFNMSYEEWDAVVKTHLKGHFSLIKPASILMRQQRSGRIINFTSITGLVGSAGQANYGAAKGGISGLTRVVARDLGRYGVTTNCIAPAAATRMTATIANRPPAARGPGGPGGAPGAGGPPPGAPASGPPPGAPAGGPPGADDPMRAADMIAPMVCFLASDFAWNVNGQIFAVQGGTVSLIHHPLPEKTIFKPGLWTLDELDKAVPEMLLRGTTNPQPPADDVDVPGRPKPEAAAATEGAN